MLNKCSWQEKLWRDSRPLNGYQGIQQSILQKNCLLYGSNELQEKQALHTMRGRQPTQILMLGYKLISSTVRIES